MSTFMALCRREWLEHRVGLGWAPLVLLVLLMVVSLGFAVGNSAELNNIPWGNLSEEELEQEAYSAGARSAAFSVLAFPFVWLYVITVASILLSSLFEERNNRTILFWKSMPASSTQSVLSKLFSATIIGAAVSAAAVTIAHLWVVLIVSQIIPVESAGSANLADASAFLLQWWLGFFTQLFWWFPVWGWCLLASAVARSQPVLWALLVPAALALAEGLAFGSSILSSFISGHLSTPALAWLLWNSGDVDVPLVLGHLWTSADLWLGILIGCAFIAAAIFVRERTNEL